MIGSFRACGRELYEVFSINYGVSIFLRYAGFFLSVLFYENQNNIEKSADTTSDNDSRR